MNPLLEQFLQEARDFLQDIGNKLMALEERPGDGELLTDLFRLVHTLKGNSGLFEFQDMTRVLHASEDLMEAVRDGRLAYSQELADQMLATMDLVSAMLDEIGASGALSMGFAELAQMKVAALRALIPAAVAESQASVSTVQSKRERPPALPLSEIPESARLAAFTAAGPLVPLLRVRYFPDPECFFKGEDPFFQARNTPGVVWGRAEHEEAWSPLAEMDCYRCQVTFDMLARAHREEVVEHFRYVPEEVEIETLPLLHLVVPQGNPDGGSVSEDFVAKALALLEGGDFDSLSAVVEAMLEQSTPELWFSSALRWLKALLTAAPAQTRAIRRLIESLSTLIPPAWTDSDWLTDEQSKIAESSAVVTGTVTPPPLCEEDRALIERVLAVQAEILALPDGVDWFAGRLKACAATLRAVLAWMREIPEELEEALAQALSAGSAKPLADWLAAFREGMAPVDGRELAVCAAEKRRVAEAVSPDPLAKSSQTTVRKRPAGGSEEDSKFRFRAEDVQIGKVLKVDQAKVDRLMNLIGEMVVAKNSLPYLAKRAEEEFGVQELSREIKAQYAVINRIAEEMQDAIMQVRMMPLSLVFQRFPRLVRDISRKLGKDVELVLEGEETEADKTIIESLAEPLIHIVRNSLDHGIELPEERIAAGKPPTGRLLIRAQQESDKVIIEITDDGRGIDPVVIKHKAYEKGFIADEQLERLSDQEAQNLIFMPGFSTAEEVNDLSGRGVGMDVVRNAIGKLGGTVQLSSTPGKGTTLTLSLPLSMAVTNVMIVESDRQIFGVPVEQVVETVRLPRTSVRTIKQQQVVVLRNLIVPLRALNDLLGIAAAPKTNADDELAVLVVRVGSEHIGLIVDDFDEVVDVLLKPLSGELARLTCYAGTALLGDGSVLMVLNPKELFR